MSLHLDVVDMRLMANIAEVSSLTKGAERSHLSLPSASMRVKNLEDRLGTKVFYRTSQGVSLTPAGRAVVHHSRLVLRQLEALKGDLQDYTQGIKGHLRVWANTSSITEYLPSVLRRFLTLHPGVDIEMRERLSHDGVRAVLDGSADIAIVSGGIAEPSLQAIPYAMERLVLVVGSKHPLARRKTLRFEQSLGFEYLSLPEGSAIHSFITTAAREHHVEMRFRIEVGNFEALCRMVEAGVGIAVAPESAARRYARTMNIRIVLLSDAWAVRDLHVCFRIHPPLPSFGSDLVDMLVQDPEAVASRIQSPSLLDLPQLLA